MTTNVLATQLDLRPAEFGIIIERHVPVTMSDGVTLLADVYHPKPSGRTPTILVRISYTKTLVTRWFGTTLGRLWAERGYTVVLQGTRGRRVDPLRSCRRRLGSADSLSGIRTASR